MRNKVFVATILLIASLASDQAAAHAFLDRAEPRVGSTIAVAPQEITLWFTGALEPAFSTVTVTHANQRVDTGKARVNGSSMSISVRSAGSGTYHVKWHILSKDTHPTDGNYTFTVGQ
jgi:methionine-rich copper-binding protein CopC